jgi:hypothetical protein
MEFDIDYEGEISIRGHDALSQHAFKQPECATLHVGLGSSAPHQGFLDLVMSLWYSFLILLYSSFLGFRQLDQSIVQT